MSVHEINFHLLSEAATSEFAASLAGVIQTGDLVFLSGDMGAGKTALARALIQSLNHSNPPIIIGVDKRESWARHG